MCDKLTIADNICIVYLQIYQPYFPKRLLGVYVALWHRFDSSVRHLLLEILMIKCLDEKFWRIVDGNTQQTTLMVKREELQWQHFRCTL